MWRALPLAFIASPALAHHEAVVVSFLPTMMIWAAAISVSGLAVWRRWKRRRD